MAQQGSRRAIALEHLTRDPSLQMRVVIDVEHVEALASILKEEGEIPGDLPVVFSDGQNNWLADGWHRDAAHAAAGVKKMWCMTFKGGHRDAWLHALGANADHGLQRSARDKRRAVTAALGDQEIAAKSDREVAKICGLRWPTLVSDVRRDMVRGQEIPVRKTHSIVAELAEHPEMDDVTLAKKIGVSAGEVERVRADMQRETVDLTWQAPAVQEQTDSDDLPAEFEVVGVSNEEIDAALEKAKAGTTGVFDAKGRPVEPELVEVFAGRAKIKNVITNLGKMANELKASKFETKEPWAVWLDHQTVEKLVNDIQRTLRFCSPYVVCPQCGGRGEWKRQPCKICKGFKFLPENAWTRMDAELKRLAEQWGEKGEAWEPGTDEPKQLSAA